MVSLLFGCSARSGSAFAFSFGEVSLERLKTSQMQAGGHRSARL